jgi:Zn-dependent protease
LPGIDVGQLFIAFIVLLFSLTVHEAAHAWSAGRLGDDTARQLGRVSLNPVVHADLFGTVLFPLIAMSTGVPLLGWAKPVPVDVRNLKGNWREKYMLIAAAGPASNLLLAVGAAVALRAVVTIAAPEAGGEQEGAGVFTPIVFLLFQMVSLNVLLAVFNMIPVPPLDGGNVLAGLLPGHLADHLDRIRPWGFLLLYALMLTGVLGTIMFPIRNLLIGWLLR